MLRAFRRRLTADERGAPDSGMSLVETLVATGLMLALMGVFMSLVVDMSRLTTRTQNTGRNADAVRAVYSTLEHQIRSASALNAPQKNTANGAWYLEFLTTAVKPGKAPRCTQWKVESAGAVSWRTWDKAASGAPNLTAWKRAATGVVNLPARPPFRLIPAGSTLQRQRLVVDISVKRGRTPAAGVQAEMVARNTGLETVTNNVVAATGASSVEECRQVTRS